MKLATIAFALTTLLTAGASALALGERAPMRTHRMRGVDGQMASVASVAGRHGTLVIFTCNHCPWAQAWESRITELGNTYRDRGVGVIAINPNDPVQFPADGYEQMQRRAEAAGMRFPYVVDETSNVARAYGATRTPEVFLFDRRGRLVYHGAIDDNAHQPEQIQHHYLRDALEAVIAGRAIAEGETRFLGCSIKFRE
ncbi:MAG: thioredoxin family protein [Sandaracinaceae bacterium]|nr:thioredoxin family protein [Sandaracinaceae bacterium]